MARVWFVGLTMTRYASGMRLTLPLTVAAVSAIAFAAPAFATTGCNAEGWGEGWFRDVRGCHSSYPAIKYVKEQGIVQGHPDGTFRPDVPINRAEFTKILMSVLDDDGRMCKMAAFPDAPMAEWYGPAVHKARCHGVIDGYSDGTFRPANLINYAEAAKIAANAYGLEVDGPNEWDERWYAPYSYALLEHHAVPPTVEAYDAALTRGEMAEMIYRLETGKTSMEWFAALEDGDDVSSMYVSRLSPEVEFSFPGSSFSAKERAFSIPDAFVLIHGSVFARGLFVSHVEPEVEVEGCNGMAGISGPCRPSYSMIEIGVGIVDRTVEHLALGMGHLVEVEPVTVDGRPSRVFRWGVECEGDEFVLIPMDAVRSVVVMRTFDCNVDVSYERQEEAFQSLLDSIAFQSAYVPQVAPTMRVTLLLCAPGGDVPSVTVEQTVPYSSAVADMTLRALFLPGGNYHEGAVDCDGVWLIGDDYRGVTIAGGVATVKLSRTFNEIFGEDGEEYSVSAQRSVSANLKQFPSVQSVRYVVE